jgi:hypothetical protein
MNVGKDFGKAVEHARANASRTGKPRYLHTYNGVFWMSFDPPTCGYWMVTPSGELIEVKESWHSV